MAKQEAIEAIAVEGPPLARSVLFMGIELETAPGVLVPCEETKLLGRSTVGTPRVAIARKKHEQ